MVRLQRTEPLQRVALVAVLAVTAVLYLRSLGRAPIAIGVDEARFAVHANSIATTGYDNSGHFLPLFFQLTNPLDPKDKANEWWQPMLLYLIAGMLRVAPLSEWSVRFPSVCLAVLDVGLIYLVARRLFANGWVAVVAAATLALTPAHFIFGREAMDYFCQVPVALAWLWCLLLCLQTDARWMPAATGVLIGVGLYSHISSWIVMPLYLSTTLLCFWLSGKPLRSSLELIAGFAVPQVPLMAWLLFHSSLPREMIVNYKITGGNSLSQRLDVYWDYFSPSYLFFAGGSNPMFSTRQAGVFLLPIAVLVPFGVRSLLRRNLSLVHTVVLVGFFLTPFAVVAAMPRDPKYYTPRDLLVVPFGVLVATAGVEWLWAQGRIARVVTAALLLALPIQFASFARYYFTDYQAWSAGRFDSLNLRGVAEYVIASDGSARVPAIYLSEDVGESQADQWLFYLLSRQRRDLWTRSRPFQVGPVDVKQMPPGSLLIVDAGNPQQNQLLASAQLVHVVNGVAGSPATAIFRRN